MSIKTLPLILFFVAFTLLHASCQSKEEKEKYEASLKESLNSVRMGSNILDNQLTRQLDLCSLTLASLKSQFPGKQIDADINELGNLQVDFKNARKDILPEDPNDKNINLDKIDKYIQHSSTIVGKAINKIQADPSLTGNSNISDLAVQLKGTLNRVTTARADMQTKVTQHNKNFPKDKI